MTGDPLDRKYDAADFVGAEQFAAELVARLQFELRRLRYEYDQISDRGDFLIYRREYEALVTVARAAHETVSLLDECLEDERAWEGEDLVALMERVCALAADALAQLEGAAE